MERGKDMARQKLKTKEKKTQKMTKDGLIEKNQESGELTKISSRTSDFSLDKKQNTQEKQEKQGGRTARLASYKKKQQKKQIQKIQIEKEVKENLFPYEQNFSELENNIPIFQQEIAEEKEQEYQTAKTDVKSDRKKRAIQKAFTKNEKRTKLQGISETKTNLQNIDKTPSVNGKEISAEKTKDRKINQKLHDIPITKLETRENRYFNTESDSKKILESKKQQRKSGENRRKNDFSFQQIKNKENDLPFSDTKNEKQYNNTNFQHKEQSPQKLKFQYQQHKQENRKEISKESNTSKNQNKKIQFSKQEQQNFREPFYEAPQNKSQNNQKTKYYFEELLENNKSNNNKNTKTKPQKFYFDKEQYQQYKQQQRNDKKAKIKKLQYYSSEKQYEKQETENKQNQQHTDEKEISTKDKLKLEKLENKVQKAQQNLEKAEQKLPKKTKIKFEKNVEEKAKTDKKAVKTKFRIEKEVKPQYEVKPVRNIIKRAAVTPPRSFWYKGHQKITETEKENTALEAAHKNEQRAEFLVKAGYSKWHNNRKNKPYSDVRKMEKRLQKANTKYHIEKFSVEHKKIEPNKINKKWLQKQKIKKKYAQMLRQKQNTESIRTAKDIFTQIIRAVSHVVSTQKTVIGIVAVVGVLFILSGSVLGSCSAMLSGAGTSTFAAAYTANEEEINTADLYYTELETNLQYTINHIEQTYPGYDEYRYNIGEIGHNPYKFMAYLSAMYDFFTFEDIKNDIEELFHKQYQLQIIPKTETRYDSDGNAYDWHILEVTLAVKPMEQTTIPLMNQNDCKYKYDVYMETYGNRQNFGNPFSFSWLSYVSGQYGYRLNEQGEKELHRGIDLTIPPNTNILAIHEGIITEISSDSVLGNYIVIEDEKGYQSKYAGWQRCSVTVGQEIKKGEEIALTGNMPFHLEVTHQGEYLNPMYFVENGDDGKGALPGTEGGIVIPEYPGSAMGDGSFQALITEAEKYLGYPYVWGGSNPNTSFDCSGFICWVYTQSGVHNLPRTTAQGIYNQCTPVSAENAKPGDLIFFTGTYDSANPVSHIGMYVGNGQMLHAGDPISYANINSSYWKQHLYGFGRLN